MATSRKTTTAKKTAPRPSMKKTNGTKPSPTEGVRFRVEEATNPVNIRKKDVFVVGSNGFRAEIVCGHKDGTIVQRRKAAESVAKALRG